MSTLEGPPAITGGRLFEYDLDILLEVGVNLPPEQATLLERHVHGPKGWAMTVQALINPMDRYRLVEPLLTWDADEQRPRLATYPRVVEIDWQHMLDASVYYNTLAGEPAWSRFPSLPGRARYVSAWDHPETGIYEAFRIWDLWPIDELVIEPLEEAVGNWLDVDGIYAELQMHYAADVTGEMELCDLASHYGAGEEDSHEHVFETGYGGWQYEVCNTGLAVLRDMQDRLFVEVQLPHGDKATFPRAFPGPKLPPALTPAWERLLASSEVNSIRAASVFDPSEREQLLRSERMYSPWLWLY